MPFTIYVDDDTPILIRLKKQRGEQEVALANDVLSKSAEALDNGLATIFGMSKRIVATVRAIPIVERPTEVEVTFGLELTTDAKAFVINAGVDTQINVTLKWKQQPEKNE
ncbi:MAG: hypothetical protein KF716_27995 [Anaerolineae bacterium]|nr:hypothetical protein [Anaerolineae bacterium]